MKKLFTIFWVIMFMAMAVPRNAHAQYNVGVFYMPYWYYSGSNPFAGNWARMDNYNSFLAPTRPDLVRKPMDLYGPSSSQWYDDSQQSVVETQLELMSRAGINFAIYNSFFQWYDPVNNWIPYWSEALDNNIKPGFNNHGVKFAIMWSNHFQSKLVEYGARCEEFFSSNGGLDVMLNKWATYLGHANYKTINGRPVVYINYPTTENGTPFSDNIEGMCGSCKEQPFFASMGADIHESFIQHKKTKFLLEQINAKMKQRIPGLADIYFVAVITPPIRKWNEYPGNDWIYKWDWLIRHPNEGGYSALTTYGYTNFEYNDAFDEIAQTPSCNGNPGPHRWTYNYSSMQAVYRRFYDYILGNGNVDYQVPVTAGYNQGSGNLWELTHGNPNNWDLLNAGACNNYASSPKDQAISTPTSFESSLLDGKAWADAYPSKTHGTIILSAWNEYAEGNVIEPTEYYGYDYLNKVRQTFSPWLPVIQAKKNSPSTLTPTPETGTGTAGESGFDFSIAPNPVRNVLNISLGKNITIQRQGPGNQVSFYLYNMNTHSLTKSWESKQRQSTYSFDIKGIKGGQYIVEMSSGKQKKAKHVIIVE